MATSVYRRIGPDEREALLLLGPPLAAAVREGRFESGWLSAPVRLALTEARIPAIAKATASKTAGRTLIKCISKLRRGTLFPVQPAASHVQALCMLHRTLNDVAQPDAPSIAWLMALDLQKSEALRNRRQRVHWAAQAHAGRIIPDNNLEDHLNTLAGVRSLKLSQDEQFRDTNVLHGIASAMGPACDVEWLITGTPQPPHWLRHEPHLRIAVYADVPHSLAPELVDDLCDLLASLDSESVKRASRSKVQAAVKQAKSALADSWHMRPNKALAAPVNCAGMQTTWDAVLDEIPLLPALRSLRDNEKGEARREWREARVLKVRSLRGPNLYAAHPWTGPLEDGWEAYDPVAHAKSYEHLSAVRELLADLAGTTAKQKANRRPRRGGRRRLITSRDR